MLAELVRITTSDGLKHFGAIYPAKKKHPAPLGVIMVHGMTGSFIGEIESAVPPFLAEAGYTTLVVNNRGTGFMGAATEHFEGCIADIGAAIDLMEARGFARVALFGHSKAGPKVSHYLAQTGDPRVAALGALSPASSVHEMPLWFSPQFGKRNPQRWLERAQALAAKGKGDTMFASKLWPFFVSAGTVADHLATSGDTTLENLSKVRVPVLAACGSLELEWCTVVTSLQAQAPAGFRVEVVEGADHVYTGREKDLADLMAGWMNKL
jgi:pimeloyl-ACP methyl ester carboxylesterase